MNDNVFLIHCKVCSPRLAKASEALLSICENFTIVRPWDGEALSVTNYIDEQKHYSEWCTRIVTIKDILYANIFANQGRPYKVVLESIQSTAIGNEKYADWMAPRKIKAGELSVLLKHYFALSAIASSTYEWGLIAEDDIIKINDTEFRFNECVQEFLDYRVDYMDLAGGCGLIPDIIESGKNTQLVIPARTRTNACYMVSRSFATTLVETFWPIVFPIDWHLQYLMGLNKGINCRWASRVPFLHGSESGQYKSWRSDV